jgi:hypothetical protein
MKIPDTGEKLQRFLTKLGHYPTVLEIPWLRLHDVAIRFVSNSVTFGSQYWKGYFHNVKLTVPGVTDCISTGSRYPARGPGYDWRFCSVPFQTWPKTRPTLFLSGCYPDQINNTCNVRRVRSGLRFQHHGSSSFRSNYVFLYCLYCNMINTLIVLL